MSLPKTIKSDQDYDVTFAARASWRRVQFLPGRKYRVRGEVLREVKDAVETATPVKAT